MNMNQFLMYLMLFRSCWFRGRTGGGKTAFAVECALRLVFDKANGLQRIVSNVPLALDHDSTIRTTDIIDCRDSVIVMDEAWNYLESGNFKRTKEFFAYPRHRNQVFLLPSVGNLTTYVQWLAVGRVWNGMPMSVPLWLYKLQIEPKDEKKAKKRGNNKLLWWWHPETIFGLYVHEFRDYELDPDTFFVYEVA